MIGTEHEFSINGPGFVPLPVSDNIIKSICGSVESEILFGDTKIGKELQKTVLEFIPRTPAADVAELEETLTGGIDRFYRIFKDKYTLLGLGMHPLLRLDQTAVWDHDEGEYYEVYDRLFNICQHGWLNIQALQANLSYSNNNDLVTLFNRLRSLLPYLIAITASSPMVEGKMTGSMDNRLLYYRVNQKEIPRICNGIIPERIHSVGDYRKAQEEIFAELRRRDAEILCEEWVNSGGIILRFSRSCAEIKALDEQESIHSDMAVCAFIMALLRCPVLPVEHNQDALLDLTDRAIESGTAGMRPELERLYALAWTHATPQERRVLPVIENRIRYGSLAEQMHERFRNDGSMIPMLSDLAACLRENRSYGMQPHDNH